MLPILRDLLEPPDMEAAEASLVTLWEWGMLDGPCDAPLTPTGTIAASLPIDYRLTRMLVRRQGSPRARTRHGIRARGSG